MPNRIWESRRFTLRIVRLLTKLRRRDEGRRGLFAISNERPRRVATSLTPAYREVAASANNPFTVGCTLRPLSRGAPGVSWKQNDPLCKTAVFPQIAIPIHLLNISQFPID